MTLIGSPLFEYTNEPPAQFSPDGRRFTVVIRRGNLTKNTNDYSLLLYATADALRSTQPQVLVTFSSSSNRPGIDNVRWLHDGETVVFLGARQDDGQRLYSLNTRTKQLRQVSRGGKDIAIFDTAEDLNTIIFLARPPAVEFFDAKTRERGLVVTNQLLADIMIGPSATRDDGIAHPMQLFAQRAGQRPRPIVLSGLLENDLVLPQAKLLISPNGRYAIAKTLILLPQAWRHYKLPDIENRENWVFRYLLIDMRTTSARPLLDSPSLNYLTNCAWSSDGQFVVIGGTYLPTEGYQDDAERRARESKPFAAAVEIETGRVEKIAQGDFNLMSWDPRTETVFLEPRVVASQAVSGSKSDRRLAYLKIGSSWQKVDAAVATEDSSQDLELFEQQDMNTPPRLIALSRRSGSQSVLLDPNPQFGQLKFGSVEEISWKGTDGHEAKGGLYLPPDYVPGSRYPLVIQTHGWDAGRFWIDGASTAGYAAQTLVGQGFVVAQTADTGAEDETTLREGPRQTAVYEGLIDYLDQRGLIDHSRVGILGWSRTGYHVRYALTFSKYPFAAAVIADGLDASYVQYMSWLNWGRDTEQTYERINGGSPLGDGLQSWLNHATGFNLKNVHTPTRLLAFRSDSILNNWEWFAGLRHLGTPVEMIWIPEAAHMPVRPLERITAQQGDVDWFDFWLRGHEDPNQAKSQQYRRWEQLCEMQAVQSPNRPVFCVRTTTH